MLRGQMLPATLGRLALALTALALVHVAALRLGGRCSRGLGAGGLAGPPLSGIALGKRRQPLLQPLRAAALAAGSVAAGVPAATAAGSVVAQLSRLLPAIVGAFINPTIAGGLLSGGLHAITGPDHLAAILPPSVGQRGWYGLRIGATWGLGHGVSAIFLGICAYFLKGRMSSKFRFLQQLSTLAESAVGVSLLAIGFIGIKENMGEGDNTDGHGDGDNIDLSLGSGVKTSKAIFANGVLHGFSWDGAPSLAPALAMTSWRSALSFLLAYCFGTMAAMSLTAGLVGEGSVRLGKAINSPALPKQLSITSSLIAIIIGAYWLLSAALGFSLSPPPL